MTRSIDIFLSEYTGLIIGTDLENDQTIPQIGQPGHQPRRLHRGGVCYCVGDDGCLSFVLGSYWVAKLSNIFRGTGGTNN